MELQIIIANYKVDFPDTTIPILWFLHFTIPTWNNINK